MQQLIADVYRKCKENTTAVANSIPDVPSPTRSLSLFTFHSSLKVEDSDLEFARLIGDWCLMAQMHMFGQMVMDAREREMSNYVPRKRSSKVREAYAKLPELINTELLVSEGLAKNVNAAGSTLRRWLADGLVAEVNDKNYRKCFKEIPE